MKTSMLLAAIAGLAASQTTSGAPPTVGFNYGNRKPDYGLKVYYDYYTEFQTAKKLPGAEGRFTSARLYTMVQGDSGQWPIEAITAAIETNTSLLLGFWCSAGEQHFIDELAALKATLRANKDRLHGLVQGISVGSEDLYRASPLGAGSDPGANASTIIDYVRRVKLALRGPGSEFSNTWIKDIKIGHVDTWNAYTDWNSGRKVLPELDFVGVNAFPYFQSQTDNRPENLASLFIDAHQTLQQTLIVDGLPNTPLWVTETGYPVTGPIYGHAAPGPVTANKYYHEVGCNFLFGKINTWWYIMLDAAVDPAPASANYTGADPNVAGVPKPSFGLIPPPLNGQTFEAHPFKYINLNCNLTAPAAPAPNTTTSNVTTSLAPDAPSPVATIPLLVAGGAFPMSSGTANPAAKSTTSTLLTRSSSTTSSTKAASVMFSTSSVSRTSSAPSATSSSCPANLAGPYEFPHLIVPISSTKASTSFGTQYFGTLDTSTSTLFNFDVSPSLAGKTCSVVFLFPRLDQLVWSHYDFNNQGGIRVQQLSAPATQGSTFNTAPAANGTVGAAAVASVQSGQNYVVSSGPCSAGSTLGYRVDGTGGLALKYFQDFNPAAPIGLFLRAC